MRPGRRARTPGKLVEEGPVDAVFEDPRHPYTVGLLRCIPRGGVRKDRERLDTIPGFLPSLGAELPTCVFVDRCGLAQDICRTEAPPFHDLGGGRHSRCHFWEQAHELPRAEPPAPLRVVVDADAEPVVRAEHLRKTFKQDGHEIHAVQEIALSLQPGETLGLVGESGSGKTTLARLLLGLTEPDEGSVVELDGKPIAGQDPQARRGGGPGAADRLPEPGRRAQPPLLDPPHHRAGRSRSCCDQSGRRGRGPRDRARALGPLRHAADQRPAGAAVGRPQAARGDRARVRGRAARRGLRRADVGARRLGPGGDPQPAGRAAGRQEGRVPVHLARPRRRALPVGSHRRALPRAADGARHRRAGLRARRTTRTPRRCCPRVPGLEGERRERIRLEGEIPSAADPPSGLRVPHPLPALAAATSAPRRSRRSRRYEPGHFMRCHIPLEELAEKQGAAEPPAP